MQRNDLNWQCGIKRDTWSSRFDRYEEYGDTAGVEEDEEHCNVVEWPRIGSMGVSRL